MRAITSSTVSVSVGVVPSVSARGTSGRATDTDGPSSRAVRRPSAARGSEDFEPRPSSTRSSTSARASCLCHSEESRPCASCHRSAVWPAREEEASSTCRVTSLSSSTRFWAMRSTVARSSAMRRSTSSRLAPVTRPPCRSPRAAPAAARYRERGRCCRAPPRCRPTAPGPARRSRRR